MPEQYWCLYLMCVYGSLRCTQNGLWCTRHKSRILKNIKHDFLLLISLSFVLFLVFVAFVCYLFFKVRQNHGCNLYTKLL
jgi:hypothetical protein